MPPRPPSSNKTSTGASADGPGPGMIALAPGVIARETILNWSFARSSGPGGQNVNKVETKAELRVGVDDLPINGRVRHRLRQAAGRRIVGAAEVVDELGKVRTVGGELIIASGEHRSQLQNKSECLDRLRELLVQALAEPKVRRKTKPSKGSIERRIEAKKSRGDVKKSRQQRHD